jgi:hypothetical protein
MTPYIAAKAIVEDYGTKIPLWEIGNCEVSLTVLPTNEAIVIVRGSDEFSDWLTNVCYFPSKTDLGWVHTGFWTNAVAAFDKVFADLFAISLKHPLWFAGHSKGGAEAQYIAAFCKWHCMMFSGVITFQAPHAGKLDVLKSVPVYNYAIGRDIVSRIPITLPVSRPQIEIERSLFGSFELHHKMSYVLSVLRKHPEIGNAELAPCAENLSSFQELPKSA